MEAVIVPVRSSFLEQPQRRQRRWAASALALLVLVGVAACVLLAGSPSDVDLVQEPASQPSSVDVAVKAAAVAAAVKNLHIIQLPKTAQAVSPSAIAAVRALSNDDISSMIQSAESNIVTHAAPEVSEARPQAAAATHHLQLAAAQPTAKQVAAKTVTDVTADNAGSLDVKVIAQLFEAHLAQEEAAAKAQMSKNDPPTSSYSAHPKPPPGADLMSSIRAKLDSDEKAAEDNMKGKFLEERKKILELFNKHSSDATPAAVPAPAPVSHRAAAPVNHMSAAVSHRLKMLEHLVHSDADSDNDAQYGDVHAPKADAPDSRMVARLRRSDADSDNDAQYGVTSDINNPTKSHVPSWVSKLSGQPSVGSGVDQKGLTWRQNYLSRLSKAGYERDEFAARSGAAPSV